MLDQAFSRLTKSSKEALGYADALRKKRGLPAVHVEHLLQGLYYAKKGGPTRTTFEDLSISQDQLQKRLAASDLDSHPALSGEPPAARSLPPFSAHARTALQLAQEITDAGHATKVKSRHLLAGIFALPDCEVPKVFPEVEPKVADLVPEFHVVKRKASKWSDASDIFISYKREERPVARKVADALERQGWKVWWDPRLRAGERFDDAIERALEQTRCVIVLWSRLSVSSEYVRDEAGYALRRKKLVPVAIENVELPFRFEGIQTASLTDWDGSQESPAFRKLIEDVTAILGIVSDEGEIPGFPATKDTEPERRRAQLQGRSTTTLGPFGSEELSDEKVNDVVLYLRKLHESHGEFLPEAELLPELASLFNRKTFRYEALRNCPEQSWSDRLDSAYQTHKVLQCYERNVRMTAPDKYPLYRDLLGKVGGYCMQMGALLFDPRVDYNIIKKHIGKTTFKDHLPRAIEFPTGPGKRPVIPDDINNPIEEHRTSALGLMDQIFPQ